VLIKDENLRNGHQREYEEEQNEHFYDFESLDYPKSKFEERAIVLFLVLFCVILMQTMLNLLVLMERERASASSFHHLPDSVFVPHLDCSFLSISSAATSYRSHKRKDMSKGLVF